MKEKWSILILTQPSREAFLARLQAVLRPQLEERPDVKVLIRYFNPAQDLGTNRQALLEEATGEYVNWIDDDDLVPADFVSRIYPLLDGVDYVGFRLQMFTDGQKQKPTFHSLCHKEWNGDEDGWYRDISHINPIRRELALAVPMSGGFGEDHRWADGLRALGIVKTEHYIDEVMYFYYFRNNKSDQPALPASRSEHPEWVTLQRRPICPECGSTATALAGGMRRCNQCGASWV